MQRGAPSPRPLPAAGVEGVGRCPRTPSGPGPWGQAGGGCFLASVSEAVGEVTSEAWPDAHSVTRPRTFKHVSDSESPQRSGAQTDGGRGKAVPQTCPGDPGRSERGKLPVVGQVRDGPLPGGGTGPELHGRPRVGRPGGPEGAPHAPSLQGAEGPPRSSGIWAGRPRTGLANLLPGLRHTSLGRCGPAAWGSGGSG